jgi:hypothetical protein
MQPLSDRQTCHQDSTVAHLFVRLLLVGLHLGCGSLGVILGAPQLLALVIEAVALGLQPGLLRLSRSRRLLLRADLRLLVADLLRAQNSQITDVSSVFNTDKDTHHACSSQMAASEPAFTAVQRT